MRGFAHIQVEGLRELQAAIKRQQGQLPKAIGDAHKRIGQFIIGRIPPGDPHAVGAGSGASVRPSATKREVLLRVGHTAREERKQQWGKKIVQPFAPGRPYILGVVDENEDEIEQMFLDEMTAILGPAFFEAE